MSTISSYKNTGVSSEETISEIEQLFAKFGITKLQWMTFDPANSYMVFGYEKDSQKLLFKVNIPFMDNKDQSYRILYHKIKALLIDLELGNKVYEVFANNLVVGMHNGVLQSIMEKQSALIDSGNINKLYLQVKDL